MVQKKIEALKDFTLKITPEITYHLLQDQVLVVSFLSEQQFAQYLQLTLFVEAGSIAKEAKEILVLHPTPDVLDPSIVYEEDGYYVVPECDLECSVQEVLDRHRKK